MKIKWEFNFFCVCACLLQACAYVCEKERECAIVQVYVWVSGCHDKRGVWAMRANWLPFDARSVPFRFVGIALDLRAGEYPCSISRHPAHCLLRSSSPWTICHLRAESCLGSAWNCVPDGGVSQDQSTEYDGAGVPGDLLHNLKGLSHWALMQNFNWTSNSQFALAAIIVKG